MLKILFLKVFGITWPQLIHILSTVFWAWSRASVSCPFKTRLKLSSNDFAWDAIDLADSLLLEWIIYGWEWGKKKIITYCTILTNYILQWNFLLNVRFQGHDTFYGAQVTGTFVTNRGKTCRAGKDRREPKWYIHYTSEL